MSDKFYGFSRTLKFIEEPAFAAMLAPLILYGFFQAARGGKYNPVLFYPASFFLVYTLLNTTSRVAFLAFIGGLIVFLWMARRKRLHCLLVILVTSVLILSNPFMQYRLLLLVGVSAENALETLDKDARLPMLETLRVLDREIKKRAAVQKDGHFESVRKTIEDVKGAPFLGHGISSMIVKYARGPWEWGMEHNRYLYITTTAGILTVVPYILFILALAVLSFRTLRRYAERSKGDINIGMILFASVILFGAHLINCGLERYYYWIFFGFAAAWIRNMTLMESREHSTH
jgi:O-antigen ligase